MDDRIYIDYKDKDLELILLSDGVDHEYCLTKHFGNKCFVDSSSGKFKNVYMMSESLRDAVGYNVAIKILDAENVPEDHMLRNLGMGM